MLEENRALFEALGVSRWHEAGYTGKGLKALTFERFVIPERLAGRVTDLFPGKAAEENAHGRHGAEVFLEFAPGAELYQATLSGGNAGGVWSGEAAETLLPWVRENRPCVGFRSIRSSLAGYDSLFGETFPYLSLFNSAGNDGPDDYSGIIRDECFFGVGAAELTGGSFNPAAYSSESEYVDFCGPTNVRCPNGSGGAYRFTGTSCAAPALAGMCALVQEFFLRNAGRVLSHQEMHDFITANCEAIGPADKAGAGIFRLPDPESIDLTPYETPLEIRDAGLHWAGELAPFTKPVRYIVLHHAAGNGSVEAVHAYHLSRGWKGIAYHLYVRKDGTVWRGRPMDRQGGHCSGYNGESVGICFEGNFDSEAMGAAQYAAGLRALDYARGLYPAAETVGHRELLATGCPGKNFPLEDMKGDDEMKNTEENYRVFRAFMERYEAERGQQPEPEWSKAEGSWAKAKDAGVLDGSRPQDPVKRCELAAVLDRAGLM